MTGIAALLAAVSLAGAAEPIAGRAVDQLVVRDAPTLLGAIVHRSADGTVTIAVQRDWLQQRDRRFYEGQRQGESKAILDGYRQLRDRIREWMKQRAGQKELSFFLERELKRVEMLLAEYEKTPPAPQTQFMLIEVSGDRVLGGRLQKPARRRIAMLAWERRLEDVESRSADDLQRELRAQGVDLSKDADLSDRVPFVPDDDRQWAARRAVVEHFHATRVEYQGTGEFLVRAGEGAGKNDVGRLFAGVMQQQLKQTLDEVLQEALTGRHSRKEAPTSGSPLKEAIAGAEKENALGVRITRVDQDLLHKRASVEERFLARMPDGKWETTFSHTASASAARPRPDVEKQIAADPQVKQAVELAKSLGLPGGDESLKLAIRFGAAVLQAQADAAGEFLRFRDRYLKRLDGPPLFWQADAGRGGSRITN